MSLRGFATLNIWADDVAAATAWYADFLGIEAYFMRPAPTDARPTRVPHRGLSSRAGHHRQQVRTGRRGDRARRRDHALVRRRPRRDCRAAAGVGATESSRSPARGRGVHHRGGGRPVRIVGGHEEPALPRRPRVAEVDLTGARSTSRRRSRLRGRCPGGSVHSSRPRPPHQRCRLVGVQPAGDEQVLGGRAEITRGVHSRVAQPVGVGTGGIRGGGPLRLRPARERPGSAGAPPADPPAAGVGGVSVCMLVGQQFDGRRQLLRYRFILPESLVSLLATARQPYRLRSMMFDGLGGAGQDGVAARSGASRTTSWAAPSLRPARSPGPSRRPSHPVPLCPSSSRRRSAGPGCAGRR